MEFVLDRPEGQSHCDTWTNIHPAKAHRLKEHANTNMPYFIEVRLRVSDIIHVYSNHLLITRRILQSQLFSYTSHRIDSSPPYQSTFRHRCLLMIQ